MKALSCPFQCQNLKPGLAFKLGSSLHLLRPHLIGEEVANQNLPPLLLESDCHLERREVLIGIAVPRGRGASSETRFKLKAPCALSGSRVESRSLSSRGRACTAPPRGWVARERRASRGEHLVEDLFHGAVLRHPGVGAQGGAQKQATSGGVQVERAHCCVSFFKYQILKSAAFKVVLSR